MCRLNGLDFVSKIIDFLWPQAALNSSSACGRSDGVLGTSVHVHVILPLQPYK